MAAGGTFVSGDNYEVRVQVTPKAGYRLVSPITLTINGESAAGAYDGSGNFLLSCTFTAGDGTGPAAITSVDITGVTAPVAGNAPVTTGITTSTQHVTLGNAYWKSSADDGDTWNEMPAGAKFAAGNLYEIIVPVTPASGYVLAPSTAVTVNSNNGYLGDNAALYDWDLSSTEISSVAIAGVTEPAAGNAPTVAGITTTTANVTLGSASWYVSEGGMALHTETGRSPPACRKAAACRTRPSESSDPHWW